VNLQRPKIRVLDDHEHAAPVDLGHSGSKVQTTPLPTDVPMPDRTKRPSLAPVVVCAVLVSLAGAKPGGAADKARCVPVPDGGQPVVAKTDAQGTIHLLFNSVDGPRYTKSTDHGRTFSVAIPVVERASHTPGLKFSAWDMAVGPGGCVHVALGTNAWKLKLPKDEWAYFYARLDAGAHAFTAAQNLNHKPSEGFSLAADDAGNVSACWLSGKLFANVSHDNGKTFAPAVEVDPLIDPCDCCTTSAVYGADGRLAILYREETNNERDVYLVMWDQARNKTSRARVSGTSWKVNACPMSYFAVTRSPAGFLAVWPTKGQVYFARLDREGAPAASGEIRTPGTTGMRTGMLALGAADGGTLVAWKKGDQLSWQLFDRGGQPAGLPGSVRSAGDGVAGVLDKNGEFILFR
jgi:hypothetical protein